MAGQSKVLAGVRPDGLEDAPQLQVDIDRDRASALGVSFDTINAALSTALGSTYVNDFPNAGRLQRVVVQADAPERMQPDDLLQINVLSNQGKPVPMAAFATTRWITGPIQTIRFNGYPTMRISGDAAPGLLDRRCDGRDGAARVAAAGRLRVRVDRAVARGTPVGLDRDDPARLLAARGVLVPLGALRELVDPVLGAAGGAARRARRGPRRDVRDMPNDVFFKVGLITVIGLSAKNAILIIEFAKDLHAQGKDLVQATLEAVHLRFPADPDDLDRVHPRRAAAGRLDRRRLGQPARDRHRRDERHDHRDGARGLLRAGLLRRRPALLQGQRPPAQDVCARDGRAGEAGSCERG
jgi:multidrug efflux pump